MVRACFCAIVLMLVFGVPDLGEVPQAPDRPGKPEDAPGPGGPGEPDVDPEASILFKRAETLFIEGELKEAADAFRKVVDENPGTDLAAKAREYLDLIE